MSKEAKRDVLVMFFIIAVMLGGLFLVRANAADAVDSGPTWKQEGEVLNNALGETLIGYKSSDSKYLMTVMVDYSHDGKIRFIRSVRITKLEGTFDKSERVAAVKYLAPRAFFRGEVDAIQFWRSDRGEVMASSRDIVYHRK